MTKLNERNDNTKGVIHLMVTSLCLRNCKHCCNKQYDLNDIPYVTDEELREAHTLCLTGGEPFAFADPVNIATYYKRKYKNIQRVYVYTNATELAEWLVDNYDLSNIDGLNISIKNEADADLFNSYIKNNRDIKEMPSNLVYVFDNLYGEKAEGFKIIYREWQEDFEPANDSIFRKI